MVVEAADLDVSKLALAGPDEAALVEELAGLSRAIGLSLHLHALQCAAIRQRDEAQVWGVVEGVADDHPVGDVDPPEEPVVGEDAVAAPALVLRGGGELLGRPAARGGGVEEDGVVAGGVNGVKLGDHEVAGVVRVGDEADAAARAEVEAAERAGVGAGELGGGHGEEAVGGAGAGVAEEVLGAVDAGAAPGGLDEEAGGGGVGDEDDGEEAGEVGAQHQGGGARRVVEVEQEVRVWVDPLVPGADDDGDGGKDHPWALLLGRHGWRLARLEALGWMGFGTWQVDLVLIRVAAACFRGEGEKGEDL